MSNRHPNELPRRKQRSGELDPNEIQSADTFRSYLRICVPPFSKDQFESDLLFPAIERDADGVSSLVLINEVVDVLRIGDLLAVDGHNQIATEQDRRVADVSLLVAAVNAGALGRSATDDRLYEDTGYGGKSHLLS